MALRLIAQPGDVVRDVLPPLTALVAVLSDRAMARGRGAGQGTGRTRGGRHTSWTLTSTYNA